MLGHLPVCAQLVMLSVCPQAQPSAAHRGDAGRGERRRAGECSLGHPALHLPAAGAARAAGATPLPVTDLQVPILHSEGKEQQTLK